MMIYRSSPLDDDGQRFEALYNLASYLDKHRPAGVVWRYGKTSPLNVLSLQVSGESMASELAVTPVWHLGPHRNDFVPMPVGGPVSFQVTQVHRRGEIESTPYAYEHVLYGDASDVLSAILRWKDAAPSEVPQPVPSIAADDLSPLRKLAGAMAVPPAIELEVDPSSPPIALTARSRETLTADITNISPPLLTLHAPRDEKGRLALGASVLLASYESEEPLGGKSAWLTALTPDGRHDPQVIRIALRPLASGPYAHMWDEARWLWDRRAASAPEDVRWGVSGLDISALGLDGRTARIVEFERRCADGGSLAERVALCILLQDEGRLEDSFELFGITLNDEVIRLIHGLPISGYLGTNLQSWTAFLRHQLRTAAPWLMPRVLAAEVERRATLRSRPRRPPRFRLAALPHQISQSKRSLMFAASKMDGTEPTIEIEDTGWDYRLPEPSWKRPLEIDLRRFGLIDAVDRQCPDTEDRVPGR